MFRTLRNHDLAVFVVVLVGPLFLAFVCFLLIQHSYAHPATTVYSHAHHLTDVFTID